MDISSNKQAFIISWSKFGSFPYDSSGKEPACNAGDPPKIQSLGWKDTSEVEMATHSSILAWEIPWTEEPGRL